VLLVFVEWEESEQRRVLLCHQDVDLVLHRLTRRRASGKVAGTEYLNRIHSILDYE
jgi:hypothetical protein